MSKKKWKKKYKDLKKNYDKLLCENIRLKAEKEGNEQIQFMTDEQILYYKGVFTRLSENILKAFRNITEG